MAWRRNQWASPLRVGVGLEVRRRIAGEEGGDTTPPEYASGEIGDVSPEDVVVQFDEIIQSPGEDYLSGFTIKLNSVAEAFETAVRTANQRGIQFTNDTDFSDSNDVVTVEYDDALGDIEDASSNALADFAAQTVTNNVGHHLFFNNNEELIWISAL